MNWKRGLGIGLMFFGIYLIGISGVITGNIVGFDDSLLNVLGIFGIVVFLVGILFVFSGMTLENAVRDSPSVRVYEINNRAQFVSADSKYFIKDKGRGILLDLVGSRDVSLGDFKAAYGLIKYDGELLKKAREVYGSELKKIVEEGSSKEKEIALKFLDVLHDGKFNVEDINGSEDKSVTYTLTHNVDKNLTLESQRIRGRLRENIFKMEERLAQGGDPGIGSHSLKGFPGDIYEARSAVNGGPRIYYRKDDTNKSITILGYSTKKTVLNAESRLEKLYGKK